MDTSKLTQGPGYSGEKLSLNFQNIEVRSLLQVIADFTNFNIVTSDTVTGALTLRLKDVPWDQALQIIMDAKGLGMRKSGSVLWIAPKDEIDARTKRDYEAAMEIQKLEPLRTQGFQLNYAKAADILLQITTSTGRCWRCYRCKHAFSVFAWFGDFRAADQSAVCNGHAHQARGNESLADYVGCTGASGDDRSPHCRSSRHLW